MEGSWNTLGCWEYFVNVLCCEFLSEMFSEIMNIGLYYVCMDGIIYKKDVIVVLFLFYHK